MSKESSAATVDFVAEKMGLHFASNPYLTRTPAVGGRWVLHG